MKQLTYLAGWVLALLAASLVALSISLPASAASGVQQRLGNVQRLLEDSSGARQVAASGVDDALQRHQKARDLYQQAVTAHQGGDDEQAGKLLDETSRTMFEAVRLAGKPQSIERKQQDDFGSRARSIEVLADALERIGKEKGRAAGSAPVVAEVRAALASAERKRAAGDLDAGRAELDAAYEKAKRAVEAMRGGETLVRTLNFASKEEEYHYELDRNDTHRMLLDVLADQRRTGASMDRMIDQFVARAAELRKQAEGQAGRGRHADAVKSLEESTRQFIRAIRSTGVYIPG